MEEIKVINGKLMKDGHIIPAEIGNPEHIEAIKAFERCRAERELQAKNGGIGIVVEAANITYTPRFLFTCICGHEIKACGSEEDASDHWDIINIDPDIIDETVECSVCGREYTIEGGKAKLEE